MKEGIGFNILVWCGLLISRVTGCTPELPMADLERSAVYRLDTGHCLKFASLPENWHPKWITGAGSKERKVGAQLSRTIDGVDYGASIDFDTPPQRYAPYIGRERLLKDDAPPYQAWTGEHGPRAYANGSEKDYTRYIECETPDYGPRKQRVYKCSLTEASGGGANFYVSFPGDQMSRADAAIDEAEAVLAKLEHPCVGAIAPPNYPGKP